MLKKLQALRRILSTTYRTRSIWNNPVAALLFFGYASKSPRLMARPFSFHWSGYPFYCRVLDFSAVDEILVKQEYGFIRPILLNSSVSPIIVDGGANIGIFSLYAFSLRPDARVIALEPSSSAFAVLKRNQARNPQLSWQIIQGALWSEDGSITFENREFSTSSRVFALSAGQKTYPTEEVPSYTLARLMTDQVPEVAITILKLDIEGAEEAVLTAQPALLDRVEHLIIELHPASIDEHRVRKLIEVHFSTVYDIPNRESSKPLLLASK